MSTRWVAIKTGNTQKTYLSKSASPLIIWPCYLHASKVTRRMDDNKNGWFHERKNVYIVIRNKCCRWLGMRVAFVSVYQLGWSQYGEWYDLISTIKSWKNDLISFLISYADWVTLISTHLLMFYRCLSHVFKRKNCIEIAMNANK